MNTNTHVCVHWITDTLVIHTHILEYTDRQTENVMNNGWILNYGNYSNNVCYRYIVAIEHVTLDPWVWRRLDPDRRPPLLMDRLNPRSRSSVQQALLRPPH
jgi:hypothetical protein